MVGFWRASPRDAGNWAGTSALLSPQDPLWLLHPHPGTDSLLMLELPITSHGYKTQMLRSQHLATRAKQPQNSSNEVAPCMGTREVSPASETASLSHSPGKHICKKAALKGTNNSLQTPGELLFACFAKTAIRLRRRGLFRVSLQETLIAAHIGKVTCLAAQIPVQFQSFFC